MKNVIDNEMPRSDYETPVIKIFTFTMENILMASEAGEPTGSKDNGTAPDILNDWLFN